MSARRRRAPRGAGDELREEILGVTTELLLKTGNAKAVSIRSVAQQVGVTPPSIYLHFVDKNALLEAVCARYLEKLDDEMQRVAGQEIKDGSPGLDVLRAQSLAYIRFALKTPELYRIATMEQGHPGSEVDITLTSSAFAHMRASVAALIAEEIYPPRDSTTVTLELWAAVHGVAALLISRPYLPWGDAEEFADRVLRSLCYGHIVSGAIRPTDPPHETVAWLKEVVDERRGR